MRLQIFRNLRVKEKEIINYESFILFLCCVAHIGMQIFVFRFLLSLGFRKKTFFEKVWKLFDHLLKKNNLISDHLILEKYYRIL